MLAPATTAPFASATLPLNCPVPPCANAVATVHKVMKRKLRIDLCMILPPTSLKPTPVKTTNVRFLLRLRKAQNRARLRRVNLRFATLRGTGRLRRTTLMVLQQTATVHVCQLLDNLLVSQTEVAIAAKQLLDQKVIKKLHVEGGETDSRIDVCMHRATTLQLCKLRGETSPQVVNQPFKHLAEVAVLEFEYVDVHQQPEVVMVVHNLLDLLAETDERLGFKRFALS